MGLHALSLLLAFAVAEQATVPQQQKVATAVIRGYVYAKDTGAPLVDARLTLSWDRNPSERLSAVTDAEGVFEFRDVRPGRYMLTGQHDGFIPLIYGQDSAVRTNIWITVIEGQDLAGMDLRMSSGGVITGTVYGEEGEPLAGVQVQAFLSLFARPQPQLMARSAATSDDRGHFRLFGLAPGRYYVQASLEKQVFEGSTRKYEASLYPGTSATKDAQAIDLERGGEAGPIDFHMHSLPTYTVSGQVLEESGLPATGGRVLAVYADPAFIDRRPAGPEAPLQDGAFHLLGLLPGRYLLMVTLDRVANGESWLYSKAFTLKDGNLEGLVVHLGRAPIVRGRLIAANGPTPASVAGLHVTLRRKGEQKIIFTGSRTEGIVGEDGRFEIRNLQPGEYNLSLVRMPPPVTEAGPSFFVSQLHVQGNDVIEQGLSVVEGVVTEVEVVLDYACGTVTGRLLDESGVPAQAAIVMYAAEAAKRESERYFRLTTSDQNGQFTIPGVIPGDYLIVPFPAPGAARAENPLLTAQLLRHATGISVPRNSVITQDLRLTLEIRAVLAAFPF